MHVSVCALVCVCVPQCLPVKQRACPSEVLLFSPVLLPPAACLPPPAGRSRLPHADLFNCLPVPGPTGGCVCVYLLRREGQGRRQTQTHMCTHNRYTQGGGKKKSKKEKNNTHGVSVRYCQAHLVSVCPIKEASLKSACCFVRAETVHTSHPQIWKVPTMTQMGT